MRRIAAFIALTRPKFLPLSVVPVVLSATVAVRQGPISYGRLLLSLCGVVLLHAAGNAANDCYDYVLGADKVDTTGRYSGGSGVLARQIVTVREAKVLFYVLFALSTIIALYLSIGWSYHPLVLGLSGALSALFYTMPPFKLAYRGLGEVTVAATFGPGIMLGTYYVLRGCYSANVLLVGAVVGLLIGSVLFINEMKDAQTDHAAGKYTLAVRLKLGLK